MIWPFKRKNRKKDGSEITFQITTEISPSPQSLEVYNKRYPILDRHFELTEQLRNTYTPSNAKAVEKGIVICREMIKIAEQAKAAFEEQQRNQAKVAKEMGWERPKQQGLPLHLGYKQLAIILEKRGEFEEAIAVARQARAQGWNGDWEKRIARCEARIAKRNGNA